jgi:hypothetical protein
MVNHSAWGLMKSFSLHISLATRLIMIEEVQLLVITAHAFQSINMAHNLSCWPIRLLLVNTLLRRQCHERHRRQQNNNQFRQTCNHDVFYIRGNTDMLLRMDPGRKICRHPQLPELPGDRTAMRRVGAQAPDSLGLDGCVQSLPTARRA